ncbi:hypothetical protein BDV10DRAFT_151766 [Aspergillus recurvatus]
MFYPFVVLSTIFNSYGTSWANFVFGYIITRSSVSCIKYDASATYTSRAVSEKPGLHSYAIITRPSKVQPGARGPASDAYTQRVMRVGTITGSSN